MPLGSIRNRWLTLALALAIPAGCSAAASRGSDRGGAGDAVVAPLGDGAPPEDDGSMGDPAWVDAGLVDCGPDAFDGALDGAADASADVSDAAVDLGLDCTSDAATADGGTGAPALLGCTGLYASWPARMIAPNVIAYDPGLHLWSDGAEKMRYISLPPGAKIDTSAMDEWTFPVGTKLWKEFAIGGRKLETRFLWKRSATEWVRTTYQWSPDEKDAVELTTGSTLGNAYEIPSVDKCTTCHMGRADFVLGFEAVSLSSPGASGLTMSDLVKRGLVTNAPGAPITIPGNATEKAALGWLHANCGTACHNPSPNSFAGSTGMWLRLEVGQLASVTSTDTYRTAVNVPSAFQPSGQSGFMRIKPHDPAHSCITFRDSTRDQNGEGNQMPPIDTHAVDTNGVALVTNWIDAMP
jgi:hypothetical protein